MTLKDLINEVRKLFPAKHVSVEVEWVKDRRDMEELEYRVWIKPINDFVRGNTPEQALLATKAALGYSPDLAGLDCTPEAAQ